jgi:hypothetical protein
LDFLAGAGETGAGVVPSIGFSAGGCTGSADGGVAGSVGIGGGVELSVGAWLSLFCELGSIFYFLPLRIYKPY